MSKEVVFDANYVSETLQLDNPTEILIQDRKITQLGNLTSLSSLRRLDISFNELVSLKGIEELPQLRHLSAYCCRLTDVDMLSGTRRIETLMLQQNGIPGFCPAFSYFNKLKELRLDRNQISSIQYLNHCSSLRMLDLSYNHISSLEGLAGLQNLQELRVSHNCIKDLKHLRALPSLVELDISHNQIRKLSGLQLLPTIEVLHAECNAIETLKIPQTYSHQSKKLDKHLKSDDSSHHSSHDQANRACNLKKLPSSDGTEEGIGLPELKEAFLSGNKLTSLHGLHTLGKNLEVLDVSDNQISETREEFFRCLSVLTNLNELFAAGNPVTNDVILHDPVSTATKDFLSKLKEFCPLIAYVNDLKLDKLLHAAPADADNDSIFHTWDDASAAKSIAAIEVAPIEDDEEQLEVEEEPTDARNPRLVIETMVTKEEIVLKETIFTNLLNHTKDMLINAVKAYIDTKKAKLPNAEEDINANDELVAAYGANAAVPLPECPTPSETEPQKEKEDQEHFKPNAERLSMKDSTSSANSSAPALKSKPPLRANPSKLDSKVLDARSGSTSAKEDTSHVLRSQSAGIQKSEILEAKQLVDEVLVQSTKIGKPLRKSNSARIEKDKSTTDDVKFKTVVRGGSFSIGVGNTGSAALLSKPLDRKSGIEAENDDASIQWAMLPVDARGGERGKMKDDDSDEEDCATLLTEMNLETDSTALNWEDLGSKTTDAEGITEEDLVSPRYVPVATAELTKPPSKAAIAKPLRNFKIPKEAKSAIARDQTGCSRHS